MANFGFGLEQGCLHPHFCGWAGSVSGWMAGEGAALFPSKTCDLNVTADGVE